ncbi:MULTISPECIES: peptidase [unclassified Methylophaga]|uniref:peptidase n=1 Tax=unclassified Methylophaga TaxID=2629249 RepID=UPI000C8A5DCF|nr:MULTISPECIES: peptidase [unclassified Methylophaga]MBN46779.1 peptidase [Methylophaga sp.]|tara:strand:- start:89886 stop:90593 length:708 start_codon:yes stop_codon:yes gene_type:complete
MLKGIKVAGVVIISSLILIWLACGILINHAKDLKLEQIKLAAPWLLEHYKVTDVPVKNGWLLADQLFIEIESQLYVNAEPKLRLNRPLLGGILLEDIIALATDDNLILFDTGGQYIGALGAAELIPAEIQNIGLHHGLPVLQTRTGMWQGNSILDDWQLISLDGVSWSESVPIPDSTLDELRQQFEAYGITLGTLLTDLHSGRFFGEQGRWLIDALILLIVVLALRGMFGLSDKS